MFLIFFSSEIFKISPLKPMFLKGPSIFVPLFVIMGIYFALARGSSASVGDCRNMPAKPAVRRSPQQRTSQVHQTRSRTLQTFKLIYKRLNL